MSEQSGPTDGSAIISGSPGAKSGQGSRFYLWVAALALVQAILLHAALFGGKGLVPADGIFNFAPWLSATNGPSNSLLADQYLVFVPQRIFMHDEFLQGRFPLWNPNLCCGLPNLASFSGALLFPINLLLMPVSPFYAAGISAFLKLFLAGWFMMLYLRLLGGSDSAAFLSGLVFSLCGFMICWLGHTHVNCAMCLPVLLYLVEKSFQYGPGKVADVTSPPAMRIWVGLAVAIGCFLLGSYPPTIVHGAILLSVYFLFRLAMEKNGRPRSRIALAAGAAILGFFLAAPALLPFLEYYRHSSMAASSMTLDRGSLHSPISSLILYLFPHLNGSPTEGFEDTMLTMGIGNLMPNFMERTGYVGVLPLLFCLSAVVFRRCRWTLFYATVALICGLGVFGVPPFPVIFRTLPVLKQISPMRLILIASLSLAILAGLGWDSFCRLESSRKRIWLVTVFWAAVGLLLLAYWQRVAPRWKWVDAEHRAFLEPQLFMMAGSLAVSAVLLLPSMRRHAGTRALLGLGWVAVDLLNFGRGLNPAIPHSSYYPPTPAIEWLQQDKSDFRILGMGMTFPPNTAELFGLKDARGYDFVTVRNYEELINGNAGDFFFYRSADTLPAALPLLGVKYVLNFNYPAPDPAGFDMVYSNEITIYRNRNFYGRVMPVFNFEVCPDRASILAKVRSGHFDPRQTLLLEQPPARDKTETGSATETAGSEASVLAEAPDEVDVQASMARPGFLLLLDSYFPGWAATVNGSNVPILKADYNFRAVAVPSGKSVVRFVYRPASFRAGGEMFLAGLTVLAVIFIGSFRAARRPRTLKKDFQ